MAPLTFPFWKLVSYWLYLALYFVVCEAMWDYPAENLKTVLFKALPILHLIFIILSTNNREKGYSGYKWNILIGLLFSMAGDACLVWRFSLFIPGLLFFAIAHMFYIRAYGFSPFGSGPTVTSCFIIAGFAYMTIARSISEEGGMMYILVFLYSSLIFTLKWRSVVCFQTWPSLGSFCACFGSILFAISDFLIAFDKWHKPVDGAALFIMVTYFAAQMFITLSVACFVERPRAKED